MTHSTQTISPLRQRMIEDMLLRLVCRASETVIPFSVSLFRRC